MRVLSLSVFHLTSSIKRCFMYRSVSWIHLSYFSCQSFVLFAITVAVTGRNIVPPFTCSIRRTSFLFSSFLWHSFLVHNEIKNTCRTETWSLITFVIIGGIIRIHFVYRMETKVICANFEYTKILFSPLVADSTEIHSKCWRSCKSGVIDNESTLIRSTYCVIWDHNCLNTLRPTF